MLTDQEFLVQFEDKTLKPKEFSHIGHLRLAYLYLRQYEIEKALDTISDGIRTFADFHGQPKKFHKTITTAITLIIKARLNRFSYLSFEHFLKENIDLIENWRAVIKEYYSYDLLQNEDARLYFLKPDIKAFNV